MSQAKGQHRSRVVLVTGTSSGIGRAVAAHLGAIGHKVFGGSLTAPTDPPLAGVVTLPLDVRDQSAVAAFVGQALAAEERIDVLVNNAGYAMLAALEEVTLDEGRAQFDVNFFGLVRMVNAVMPHLREQGSGTIIAISSGAGMTGEPFAGYYSPTKFAVEGYVETLRHEVRPFGLFACLVQPGWHNTSIADNAVRASEPLIAYDAARAHFEPVVRAFLERGQNPARVAECISAIISTRRPKLHYRVGRDVRGNAVARRVLPESLFQHLVARYYGITAPVPPQQVDQPPTDQERPECA